MREKVEKALESIRPALQADGGDIQLVSIENDIVKVRLMGACLGYCPQGAITIEERQAEPYDEKKVMENIIRQGKNVIKAHLVHLKSHNQDEYFKQALAYLKEKGIENPLDDTNVEEFKPTECLGTKIIDFRNKGKN